MRRYPAADQPTERRTTHSATPPQSPQTAKREQNYGWPGNSSSHPFTRNCTVQLTIRSPLGRAQKTNDPSCTLSGARLHLFFLLVNASASSAISHKSPAGKTDFRSLYAAGAIVRTGQACNLSVSQPPACTISPPSLTISLALNEALHVHRSRNRQRICLRTVRMTSTISLYLVAIGANGLFASAIIPFILLEHLPLTHSRRNRVNSLRQPFSVAEEPQ